MCIAIPKFVAGQDNYLWFSDPSAPLNLWVDFEDSNGKNPCVIPLTPYTLYNFSKPWLLFWNNFYSHLVRFRIMIEFLYVSLEPDNHCSLSQDPNLRINVTIRWILWTVNTMEREIYLLPIMVLWREVKSLSSKDLSYQNCKQCHSHQPLSVFNIKINIHIYIPLFQLLLLTYIYLSVYSHEALGQTTQETPKLASSHGWMQVLSVLIFSEFLWVNYKNGPSLLSLSSLP